MLIPMYLMLVLTLFIGTYTVLGRIRSVSKGEVKIKTYRTMDYDAMPEKLAVAGRCFNNQFEVPTLFYAVTISIAALGHVDVFYVGCAWTYAVLRIGHSLVQATFDRVMVRFVLFVLSWLVLTVMVVREAIMVFS